MGNTTTYAYKCHRCGYFTGWCSYGVRESSRDSHERWHRESDALQAATAEQERMAAQNKVREQELRCAREAADREAERLRMEQLQRDLQLKLAREAELRQQQEAEEKRQAAERGRIEHRIQTALAEAAKVFAKYPQLVVPEARLVRRRRIGSGGWADVFEAELDGLTVAIKVPQQQTGAADSTVTVASASAEVDVLRRLNHPNIVQLLGIVNAGPGKPVTLILQRLPGVSLRQHLDGAKPSRRSIMAVLRQLASALTYLHSPAVAVAHLDVKAANVIFDAAGGEGGTGKAVLIDFGSARSLAAQYPRGFCPTVGGGVAESTVIRDADGLSTLAGTPTHMAPEVINGEGFSDRSDVYSYAILVHEVAFETPWEAGLGQRMIFNRVTRGQRPSVVGPTAAPPEVVALMQRCWAPQPLSRPTMAEIYSLLTRAGAA